MFEVLKGGSPEVEFWNAAGRGKKTNVEWKHFFEGRGFRAGVDFPASLFYEYLSLFKLLANSSDSFTNPVATNL